MISFCRRLYVQTADRRALASSSSILISACCPQRRLGFDVMQDAVHAGKVKAVGVSEVSVDELRIIHSVVPVKVVELKWSLFDRKNEVGGCCCDSSESASCL